MISFDCPKCRQRFQVDDKLAGRKVKCSGCDAEILIPETLEATRPYHTTKVTQDEETPSGLSAKTMALFIGGACLVGLAVIVWFFATRDTWEIDNVPRLSKMLVEADQLQQSEPLRAYKKYDEVLNETKQHKITDAFFLKLLANAEKSRTVLYPKVQEQIQAEEAEKQKRTQQEAQLAAAEKQRLADEDARNLAIAEAERLAVEKQEAETKRRKEAIAIYRNAPNSARTALNVAKKLEARTEVGINYRDYSTVVGEAWGDVKIFVESPEGKSIPEFSLLLTEALRHYKLALDIWQDKIQYPRLYGDRTDVDRLMQACWARAGKLNKLAESLLEPDKIESTLEVISKLPNSEEDLSAAWRGITDKVLNRRP